MGVLERKERKIKQNPYPVQCNNTRKNDIFIFRKSVRPSIEAIKIVSVITVYIDDL